MAETFDHPRHFHLRTFFLTSFFSEGLVSPTPIRLSSFFPMTQLQAATTTKPDSVCVDELTRTFNTALIASRASSVRDYSAELFALAETPAFRTILQAIRQHAHQNGISEREAADAVIQAFRKADQLWGEYVFQEGVDRLKRQH